MSGDWSRVSALALGVISSYHITRLLRKTSRLKTACLHPYPILRTASWR